jgi:high-affinity K+ transport system ATPase subunit B
MRTFVIPIVAAIFICNHLSNLDILNLVQPNSTIPDSKNLIFNPLIPFCPICLAINRFICRSKADIKALFCKVQPFAPDLPNI